MLKEEIKSLLLNTEREGMENLIEYLEENGFFIAPCSTQYHLAKEEGLAQHSLNVYEIMNNMADVIAPYNKAGIEYGTGINAINVDSTIITALLHDVGKIGNFGKPNYVENILKVGKRSEAKPYVTNSDLLYVPHEINSIQIISRFIELTEEEHFAILYHNGMYGDLKYSLNGKETPLQMLLHFADLWCSRVVEKDFTGGEF